MRTIWKEFLDPWKAEAVRVSVPMGAKILHCAAEGSHPAIWFLCDSMAEREVRSFWVVGTGGTMPDEDALVYIGTANCGQFVWHVFEDKGAESCT